MACRACPESLDTKAAGITQETTLKNQGAVFACETEKCISFEHYGFDGPSTFSWSLTILRFYAGLRASLFKV